MGEVSVESKAKGVPWALVIVSVVLMVSLGVIWNTLLSSQIWTFYNIIACDLSRTTVWKQQSGQNLYGGGFTCTVRP